MRKWAISTVSSAVLMTATAMTDCSVLSSPHRPEGTQPHTTGAATSKTSAASDYSGLLIKPNAIGGLDETDTAQPPTLNPHGVPGASVVFVNKANTRAVGNTIFVLPDPDAATAALNGAKNALGTVIEGAVAQPAPVGANGTTAGGPSPDGSKAVTVGDVHRRRDFRHAQVRRCDDRCGRAATGEPGRPATRRADQDGPHLNLRPAVNQRRRGVSAAQRRCRRRWRHGALAGSRRTSSANWAVPRNVRPDPVRSRLRSLVLLLALGSAAIAATVLSGVANTADSFGFISTAAVMTASVAINTVFALVLGMLAFLYLIAASLVLCVEINVVRVDRLHPRALLSPFTDNVELTDGDRKTYTGRAKAERAKGFQRVEVSFDQRESQQRRAADTPRPTTAHG